MASEIDVVTSVVTVGISSLVERVRSVSGLVGDSVVRESFRDPSVFLLSSEVSSSFSVDFS